jgi:transcription initiation factor TFIID subunit 5
LLNNNQLTSSTISLQVIEYLAKKGYSRTEAMLRMESANQEIDGRPLPPPSEEARPKVKPAFGELVATSWIDTRSWWSYYSHSFRYDESVDRR